MRIVIDLQGAQGASRHRGIGRYSLHFAQALVRNAVDHDVFIALNGNFADTIESIRAGFQGLIPQDRIVVWDAPSPVASANTANTQRRQAAECIREAFLAALQPDWLVVTSLFEGWGDDAVTSIGRHTKLLTAVVLYDLIPLIYRDLYLSHPAFNRWYQEQLDHIRRADLLLAISDSSGREAVDYLDFDPASVVPIGTDCDARFRPTELTDAQREHLRTAYGIDRPFVMYTGGIDHRKNIEGLIRAYAALPRVISGSFQLAVVCAAQASDRERLLSVAREVGFAEGELVFTGFVPDDDLLALYNACTLFVFPSWHEGFGLPVLEAMRCGKAVLAANTSSLPEVVGRSDALFDPFDERSMAALMEHALTNEAFRCELERHALSHSQRFSWDATARKALAALQAAPRPTAISPVPAPQGRRPRLAYVSPLPPERSGIADYSAELLPELMRWYEVEVIVAQSEVSDAYIRNNCPIRTVDEFRARAASYDRVLYHFGNSHFHAHMFALLEAIPGVVVLHDFFLSGIQAHRQVHGHPTHAWDQSLLDSHGYCAVRERYAAADTADIIWRYPANVSVLQSALGVIVHSTYSCSLACQWYGDDAAVDWAVIPHLRVPVTAEGREAARAVLGLAEDDLIVCSFGLLGPTKLNQRLLAAWLASPLATDPKAYLVFVGENDDGNYGWSLLRRIRESGVGERIRITGWADAQSFRHFLSAADIAVQLRTLSRGETSGTVLDCMNHGLATIVNAHGSMAHLDPAGVWMLQDAFDDNELIEALATLARDAGRRHGLGAKAREIIQTRHAPQGCAAQYFDTIEGIYRRAEADLPGLLSNFARHSVPEEVWPSLAASLARSFPPEPRQRQLLVDVSELVQRDARSGIQRVVRAMLREWLHNPPQGFQVEPVFATAEAPGYRYARRWTCDFLGIPSDWTEDALADAWVGDVFIALDLQPHVAPFQQSYLQTWRNHGVKVWFVVYDLLPVLRPQMFLEGAQPIHTRWLEAISHFDGVACISHAVADEMAQWLAAFGPKRERPLAIASFHLGADVEQSVPTKGLPADAKAVLAALKSRPSFLMVGTVEPRKGHAQTLEAFELLWDDGLDANLVIVGKQGWMVERLVERLRAHPAFGKRFFWFEGITDEYLEKVYAASTCLIAASYGEGFGLPLIEAAQHKLPIIAREIPVFREVAGEHAFYFNDNTPEALAQTIQNWLEMHDKGQHPRSDAMPWLTWKQSANQLLEILGIQPTQVIR
jgi:glycosyltransferase involved in cell wall biosynthesis